MGTAERRNAILRALCRRRHETLRKESKRIRMNYQDYIKSELLVLIPVLYFIGMGLKKSNLADKWIPLVLGIVSVFMSAVWVSANNRIYGMLTHTCPMKYIPTEMLMSTKATEDKESLDYPLNIDRSTEEWLDKLEETVDYQIWYCGHYHIDKDIDKLRIMYQKIKPLHNGE